MVFHQINGDGAGPIVSSISTDVTGKTFTDITVSKNVPGTSGKSNAANQDFPWPTSQLARLALALSEH
jgi:hypothetical protein